jgi:D-apionolactonase
MPMASTTESGSVPLRVVRYGVDAPLPERRTLRAGPLTAVLENGDLRYVRAGDVEVVRRLYMAVRNRNWDTIEPRYTSFEVEDRGDAFTVRFVAEHVKNDVDFVWNGTIEGAADGTIAFTMDGAPRTDFLRNRIGFCVLHPSDLAGEPAEVETPAGTVRGEFPRRISPHQPFVDMVAIGHAAGPNARFTIRFEGDLFEMEDQRNWTDASYKTYCTPLRIPYPVEVKAGERIVQRVTLSLTGTPAVAATGGPAPDVEVGATPVATLPPIGLGVSSHALPLTEVEVAGLQTLKPAHLWRDLDLGDEGWEERLRGGSAQAAVLGAGLELSVVAAPGGGGFERLAAALRESPVPVLRIFVFPAVSEPIVFPRHDLETTPEVMARAREAFARAGVAARLGGGSRAYFTELNRALSLPLDQMEVVTYTINPQVHAFDNLSLVETLSAQAETVASARAIAGELPLAVGPITLKQPFNPNATAAPPKPGRDELPPEVEPRQLSLFGAGWTLGSIHRLAEAGVASLTYYETTGWRGLIERAENLTRGHLFPSRAGQLFPLFHVFAALADFAGGEVLPVTLRDPLAAEALAVRAGDRVRILVANFEDAPRTVALRAPLADATVRTLDETNVEAATTDVDHLRAAGGTTVATEGGAITLDMHPFAVARIDGRFAG